MKPSTKQQGRLRHRRTSAFTLVETMVGLGIYLGIFVGVMVGLQLFGMRICTLSSTKLSATTNARQTLNVLRRQIRSAKQMYVGTYINGTFARIADGQPQTGNALEIFVVDTNDAPNAIPVIYFQKSSSTTNALYSINNNVVSVLARDVTNYFVFTAEDFQANVLSKYDNNPVIRVTMQFYQREYSVGNNGADAHNFYRLQTRVSRRTNQ